MVPHLLDHSLVGEEAGGACVLVEEDNLLLHHTVRSTAATAWRTGGCTGPVAACRHSTAGTAHTVQGLPLEDHVQEVHEVVLAWDLVHLVLHIVALVPHHTRHILLHILHQVLVLPEDEDRIIKNNFED